MDKKGGIFQNAVILFGAMTVTKIIGALLKIPLGNILGGLGMGYFSSAFSVFQPVYALTCAAFPTVMTRLIAQSIAEDKKNGIDEIKSAALRYALAIGFFGMILILTISAPFATYIANSPKSIPAMLILAPAVMFCSVASVYKGYYEGLNNMIPTAMSQIVESSFKALLGVSLSYITLAKTNSLPHAAAAAVLGLTISEALGTLSLFIYSKYKNSKKKISISA
ncbi:MAG: oligosaccharide flippase family protein, partial [Eubacterium sp.]|nr:oligosaccharide flippase family protein [Eubacterium sp.]